MNFQSRANCWEIAAALTECNELLRNDIERWSAELEQAMRKIEKLTQDLRAIRDCVGAVEPGESSNRELALRKPRRKQARKLKTCECSGGCKTKRCICFRLKRQCRNSCRCKCGRDQHKNRKIPKVADPQIFFREISYMQN